MGEVPTAGDNAAMESLSPLPQKNAPNPRGGTPREDLRISIVTRNQRTTDRHRRSNTSKEPAPIELEATRPVGQQCGPGSRRHLLIHQTQVLATAAKRGPAPGRPGILHLWSTWSTATPRTSDRA